MSLPTRLKKIEVPSELKDETIRDLKAKLMDLQDEHNAQEAKHMDFVRMLQAQMKEEQRKRERIEQKAALLEEKREIFALDVQKNADSKIAAVESDVIRWKKLYENEVRRHKAEIDGGTGIMLERYLMQIEDWRQKYMREKKKHRDFEERILEEQSILISRMVADKRSMLLEFQERAEREAKERLDIATKEAVDQFGSLEKKCAELSHDIDILTRENDALKRKTTELQMDLRVTKEREKVLTKATVKSEQRTSELMQRTEVLEEAAMSAEMAARDAIKMEEASFKVKMKEATLEKSSLERLVKLQAKEIDRLRSIATLILQKRSEIEEFLSGILTDIKRGRSSTQLSLSEKDYILSQIKELLG
ncbi:hypothetical protein ADUPG1_011268 [Aduncisulcus paluster]|uniref:Uncharacterized protein n=1 Tax=Aduncisulcus paluster TaxID=2918883 RepID=A0ABQ5JUZ8_9EUKA|nr:hypothetical protein ADUPG1_011268 [Aduncisulcus paluster]